MLLTLSLDSYKLKEFAEDNIRFLENGRKFSKWVENTGKSRNCSSREFLLFPQCFQKKKKWLLLEWVKQHFLLYYFVFYSEPFPKRALVFTCLQYKAFENTVGKGEIARKEQFLLFP